MGDIFGNRVDKMTQLGRIGSLVPKVAHFVYREL
jgi:hypothetical protein